MFFSVSEEGGGEIAFTDLDGRPANYLKHERSWRANATMLEWPAHWGYRNNSRFYVVCRNDSKPGNERWYFDHAERRLLGYDAHHHHVLGSFGPDGFKPASERPGDPFRWNLRYMTNRWRDMASEYLTFPGGVYAVDFAGRSIKMIFAAAAGETVYSARGWRDERDEDRKLVVVSTDRSFHILTEEGSAVVSMPRAFDSRKYGPVFIGRFENPERYFVWYHLRYWVREPEEYRAEPSHLLEYDAAGRELARRTGPAVSVSSGFLCPGVVRTGHADDRGRYPGWSEPVCPLDGTIKRKHPEEHPSRLS